MTRLLLRVVQLLLELIAPGLFVTRQLDEPGALLRSRCRA